jgi:ATP-dependent RNA helicase CshB
MTTFKNYQFKDFIFDTLDKMNFKNPTPIQELVIPLALQGKDVIGKSPTGSGKTHAYLLPILNKINTSIDKVQAVILTPTRELATQIYENLVMFQKYDQKLKLRLITGGLDRARMIEKVNNTPHIVIGTPGRIKDIGLDKAEFNLMSTDILVLDEADMIMETGFMDDVSLLAAKMKDDLQMLVFSATIPNHLKVFLDKYMHNPKLVELSNINPGTITHVAYPTRHHNRKDVLLNVIDGINPYLCLIFASRKEDVDKIYRYLKRNEAKTNVDSLIGEVATVTKEIVPDDRGEVKIKGQYWLAISADNSQIEAGKKVSILAIEGNKLIVKLYV